MFSHTLNSYFQRDPESIMAALSFIQLYLSTGGEKVDDVAESVENISQVYRENNKGLSELADKIVSQLYGEVEVEESGDKKVSTID